MTDMDILATLRAYPQPEPMILDAIDEIERLREIESRAVAPLGPLEEPLDDGDTYVVPSGSGPVGQFPKDVRSLIRQWWDEHKLVDQFLTALAQHLTQCRASAQVCPLCVAIRNVERVREHEWSRTKRSESGETSD